MTYKLVLFMALLILLSHFTGAVMLDSMEQEYGHKPPKGMYPNE